MEMDRVAADRRCRLASYYRIPEGNADAARKLCDAFVAKARAEPRCLGYGFSFCDDEIHCHEEYVDADAVLAHLDHVGDFVRQALKVAEVTRLEVHGPAEELAKLEAPLAPFAPKYFVAQCGFRR